MTSPFSLDPSPNDLASKVLDQIEETRVTPRPAWQFTWKNRLLWVVCVFGVALGAAIASVLVFSVQEMDWDLYEIAGSSRMFFFRDAIPAVWAVGILLAGFAVWYAIRRTRAGYRYPVSAIIAIALSGFLIGGSLLAANDVGRALDETLGAQLPLHTPIRLKKLSLWMNPARGLIVGEVSAVDLEKNAFTLVLPDGNLIELNSTLLSPQSKATLAHASAVRIIGYAERDATTGTARFIPCAVLPWKGKEYPPIKKGKALPVDTPGPVSQFPDAVRSTGCKDLQPYAILQRIRPNH